MDPVFKVHALLSLRLGLTCREFQVQGFFRPYILGLKP